MNLATVQHRLHPLENLKIQIQVLMVKAVTALTMKTLTMKMNQKNDQGGQDTRKNDPSACHTQQAQQIIIAQIMPPGL